MITPEQVAHWVNVLSTEADRARRQRQAYCLPVGWVPDLNELLGEFLVLLDGQRVPGGCLVCGHLIEQPSRGRRRKYCSRAHRDAAYRQTA